MSLYPTRVKPRPEPKPVPGKCNVPLQKHGSRGKLCRQPEGKCPHHKGVLPVPDYLKDI